MYQAVLSSRASPLFFLAFFWHESKFGALGVCHDYQTLSPGNTRSSRIGVKDTVTVPGKGVYVKYSSWRLGALDASFRLVDPDFDYVKAGAKTIRAILPIWAPRSDRNDPAVYVNSVVNLMNDWLNGGGEVAIPTQEDIGYPVRTHWAAEYGDNRSLSMVNKFVVHDTEGYFANDEPYLAAATAPVASCHALIAPDGELVFMVPLEKTAWTPGNDAVAQTSINVEMSGFQSKEYTDAQYKSMAAFFRWCVAQGCAIPAEYAAKTGRAGILGHQDVPNPYQGGKFGGASGHTDPGPLFDWNKFIQLCKEGAGPVTQPTGDFSGTTASFQDPMTKFYVLGDFARYYQANGGLEFFGRPISSMTGGDTRYPEAQYVQWFERARFEWHPKEGKIMLGLVGREAMEESAA